MRPFFPEPRPRWPLALSTCAVVGIIALIIGLRSGVETRAGGHAPSPRPADDSLLTIAAVGDIMLGTSYPDSSTLPPGDGSALLAPFAPLLRSADIAFGNLEGPLCDAGRTSKCTDTSTNCYAFRVPVRFGSVLKDAGFDVFSLANNHAMDFASAGRRSTIRTLDSLGIVWSGPPGTVAELERKGLRIAIAAFSYDDDSNNLLRVRDAAALVSGLTARHDIVIVSFHGGAEGARYQETPDSMEVFLDERRGHVRAFAHAMVDAGADLVLGHGPHVLRAMEMYHDRLIAYSLGNFATYERFNLSGPSGIACVLEARLARDGRCAGARVHPSMQIDPGGARIDAQKRAIATLRRLSGATLRINDDGTVSAD